MGQGANEQGSSDEYAQILEKVESVVSSASDEDLNSVICVSVAFSKLAKDSEFLCSGNWDRQLAYKMMERESARLVLFALCGMVSDGN